MSTNSGNPVFQSHKDFVIKYIKEGHKKNYYVQNLGQPNWRTTSTLEKITSKLYCFKIKFNIKRRYTEISQNILVVDKI